MAGVALRGGVLRRLRGSTFELPLFHGLTPTAKCCRRIRGLLEPPGWRSGERCCRRLLGPFSMGLRAKCCRRIRGLRNPRADASGRGAAAAFAARRLTLPLSMG